MNSGFKLVDDIALLSLAMLNLGRSACDEADYVVRRGLGGVLDRLDLTPRDEVETLRMMTRSLARDHRALVDRLDKLEQSAARNPELSTLPPSRDKIGRGVTS